MTRGQNASCLGADADIDPCNFARPLRDQVRELYTLTSIVQPRPPLRIPIEVPRSVPKRDPQLTHRWLRRQHQLQPLPEHDRQRALCRSSPPPNPGPRSRTPCRCGRTSRRQLSVELLFHHRIGHGVVIFSPRERGPKVETGAPDEHGHAVARLVGSERGAEVLRGPHGCGAHPQDDVAQPKARLRRRAVVRQLAHGDAAAAGQAVRRAWPARPAPRCPHRCRSSGSRAGGRSSTGESRPRPCRVRGAARRPALRASRPRTSPTLTRTPGMLSWASIFEVLARRDGVPFHATMTSPASRPAGLGGRAFADARDQARRATTAI